MNVLALVSVLLITFTNLISNVSSHTCVCAEFNMDDCNTRANCCWNQYVNQKGITKPGVGKCRSIKYLQCKRDAKCTLQYNDPRPASSPSPFITEKVAGLVSAYNELDLGEDDYVPPGQDQTNNQDPEETTLDYPWVCKEDVEDEDTDTEHGMSNNRDHGMSSSEKDEFCESWLRDDDDELTEDDTIYAADPVDVSEIDIAAQRLYFAQKHLENMNKIETENDIISSSKPGATYQAFTGLQLGAGIVFITLLIAGMIYWQCNKDKMDKDGLQNRFISLAESNSKGTTYSTFA